MQTMVAGGPVVTQDVLVSLRACLARLKAANETVDLRVEQWTAQSKQAHLD